MIGTNETKLGKIVKNKNIKEGPCIFPFKHKYLEYNDCLDTEKGPICATEVNPKTNTMLKYGYCKKKKSPNKTIKKKLIECKSDSCSAERESPIIINKKLNTKSSKEGPKKKKKVSKKLEIVSDSEEMEGHLILNKKLKTNTYKEGVEKDKKKRMAKKLEIVSDLKPSPKINKMKRYNEEFIEIFGELADIMQRKGEVFRAKAYKEAVEALMKYPNDITDADQVSKLDKIGSTILAKMKEYQKDGKIAALEKEKSDPINLLTKVYGIGPKKAKELVQKDITNIEELRKYDEENPTALTDNMKAGLKYFDDIEKKIPRSEIDEYRKYLSKIFQDKMPATSSFEIVGSYRRGKSMSGDIDVIIKDENDDKKILNKLIDILVKDKVLLVILSKGQKKCLGISELPGFSPRRIDFLYSPMSEYPFATLYFTGSKIFNTVQRQIALDMGYTLNEQGIYEFKDKKKGNKVDKEFPNEESIFNFLNMEYIPPEERIDSTSVKRLNKEESPKIEKEEPKKIVKSESPIKNDDSSKSSIKHKTLKKRKLIIESSSSMDNLKDFKKKGLSFLKTLTESELESMIDKANNDYYKMKKSILSDSQYDILREFTMNKFPSNLIAKEGHKNTEMKVEKNKAQLPYEMWSMDKIKPDTNALKKWKKNYKGPYTLSCKLDGISGLYSTEGEEAKLYTRGNGTIGQDVSHLIPYLQLPKTKNIVIRGEFIVEKKIFNEKYGKEFSNPRNFVGGLINSKTMVTSRLYDINFVAYEVIVPELKPSEQMSLLMNEDIKVVRYVNETYEKLTNELLSDILQAWRNDYIYEIDGVICVDDKIYPRSSNNPEHAFAFKMVLGDQIAEAKVVDVIWGITKDGYLVPRVQIEPVILGGAKIEYATAHNAKFVVDNKIGVGSVIQLIRSGDVIPHILSVIEPSDEPLMPDEKYKWTETNVDIELINKKDNSTVNEKVIQGFFKTLGVEGLGPGNLNKIIAAGYNTEEKIIRMSVDDFEDIDGFKNKLANKIYNNIKIALDKVTLPELMHATNLFERGFGTKSFQNILNEYPDILTSKDERNILLKKLLNVDGIAEKTANQFLDNREKFINWIKETNLQDKLNYKIKGPTGHQLEGKKFVKTGSVDEDLLKKLIEIGMIKSGSISKNIEFLIADDKDSGTGKIDDAIKAKVPIMTSEEVYKNYSL